FTPCTGSTSMLGMLRVASRKLASTSAPSTIRALSRPSLASWSRTALVFASLADTASSTMMPPSCALAESAWRSASARTFLGRSMAWLRGVGPNERPPPRNRLTRADPCRALPVPFCLYIFLPVRQISARFFTSWVPRWRLASCQTTQRWIRSVRGVSPKIASGSVIDPAFSPLRVVTVSSMSRALLGLVGGRFRRCRAFAGGAELAGFGRVLRQHFLHRVAQHDPAALRAGHRAFDQDQAALGVGLHHAQIERGDALYTHVTGHFLVLEGLARVLAATGRADRAMRDRDAVRGTQAAEVPALHAAGEAFADRRAGHVDELADHEVIGGDLGAGRNHAVGADAELGKLALGFNLGDREIAALSLADVAHLAPTGAELQRHIAVLVRGAVADDLAFVEPQHRDRHMLAGLGEEARHAHLF